MVKDSITRLNAIEIELSELYEERRKLEASLAQEKQAEALAVFTRWNITQGNALVLFAKKTCSLFCPMLTTLVVNSIDTTSQRINLIRLYYAEEEYEPVCRVTTDAVSFHDLRELEDDYHIYVVDLVQLTVLQTKLCNLEVRPENIDACHEAIKSVADRVIS